MISLGVVSVVGIIELIGCIVIGVVFCTKKYVFQMKVDPEV
jgi:hypothetical protein